MTWRGPREVSLNGDVYGYKDRELSRLLDVPRRTPVPIAIAIGGGDAPRERLRAHGWGVLDPLDVSRTVDAYADFLAASRAELGIAKHGYVASRCGWFSDRSAAYLAAGRPVLHQDTGWGAWLSSGEGVFAFSDADDVVRAFDALERDYERHALAARRVAEEHFEARTVVSTLLDDAGLR
jgi:hypothetical protein